jgi:hypothetical protein
MDVRLPDGTVIQNVPDGTTKADLVAKLKANGMAVPSEWLAVEAPKPVVQEAGSMIREGGRQLGLTARYGLEGLAQVGDIVHEPFRALVNIGSGDAPRAPKSLMQMASGLADSVGLPSPEGANERVIGDASRLVAGAGGMAGAARSAAAGATGVTQGVLQQLAAAPGKQAVTAAAGGASGGAVREAGGGPVEQFLASLAGGVGAGLSANAAQGLASRGVNSLRNLLTPQSVQLRNADQQIALVLERQGVNWAEVPERLRQSMRQEAAAALSTGSGLNGDALRRLLVMQRAGVTPTVGQLTQDPGLITREANLAKVAANSTDPSLQRLPNLQNRNTSALLQQLDDAGAARATSLPDASRAAISSLEGVATQRGREINGLYSAARDSSGRSLPLEGGTFTARASQLLDEAMVGGALPPGVQSTLNRISSGEVPLTVEIAEQLKTQIGKLQRATADGQSRIALGLVRQALDDAPLMRGQNPGNLPGAAGNAGQEAIDAFNLARGANRQWMNKVEASPALRAAIDGAEPDQFLTRYVLSKQASAGDVAALRQDLTPETAQTVRDFLVKHLRDAATNSTDDITKFSNASYRKALRDIGDEKLAAFFSQDELRLLKDLGDAAKYMQAQPAGSAVNNSNSGALVLGRGLDALQSIAQRLPLGLRDTISGTVQGLQQREVMSPANALRQLAAPQPGGPNLGALPLLGLIPTTAQGGDENSRYQRP